MTHDRHAPQAAGTPPSPSEVVLREMRVPQAGRLVAGLRRDDCAPDYPDIDDVLAAQRLLWAHDYGGPADEFGLFDLVADGVVVGHAGYHGTSCPGSVEISFAVVPSGRRQGTATRGVRLLLAHAVARGVHEVTAWAAADNVGSAAVVRAVGLRRGALVDAMRHYGLRLDR